MPKGNCESCNRRAPVIQSGEFAGQSGMLDYCEYCSMDLCDDCMVNGPCDEGPDGNHKAAVEDDDETEPA